VKLTGYAAVFGQLSEDLGGFRERIDPQAFARALREKHDVRALQDHTPSRILGRTVAGTLRLSADSHGLRAEIDLPASPTGDDVAAAVSRGDLTQMSFGFRTLADDWKVEGTGAGEVVRTLLDLELLDVSVVSYPAYPQTSVWDGAKGRPARGAWRGQINRLRLQLALS